MPQLTRRLVIKNSIAKSSFLNLIGAAVPMAVALITIPILIKNLGVDRFGILTIVWMLIGYFSFFDMGIGRALTQIISSKVAQFKLTEIGEIFWTSVTLLIVLSMVGACFIALLAVPLAHDILKVPEFMQDETVSVLRLMAFTIPFVVINSALIGFLSAFHRFDLINYIRLPTGVLIYVVPVIVILITNSLQPVIASMLILKILICFLNFYCCLLVLPDLKTSFVVNRDALKPILHFGGWMTITNILGPIMIQFDRFVIANLISITAVAYYTTPYEIISKLLIIPGSILSVFFPVFTSVYVKSKKDVAILFGSAVKMLIFFIFPIIHLIIIFAYSGSAFWLGESFADNSYRVVQWLAIGVFINSIAQVPFSFIQGIGKPDITSKLHLLELLLYIPSLWLMIIWKGIEGAAITWVFRASIDALLLLLISRHFYKPYYALNLRVCVYCLMLLPILLISMTISDNIFKIATTAILFIAFYLVNWKIVFSMEERSKVKSLIKNLISMGRIPRSLLR
jgi:O-antigen/teichoic acid export membrane protein